MSNKNYCPRCKGTGKITVSVTMNSETTKTDLTCIDCKGQSMSKADAIELHNYFNAEAALWCDCGNDNPDTNYFVDDTPKMKHHWCCGDCNKITQIG